MAIITRDSKGAPLTHTEMDTNLTELEQHPDGIRMPAEAGIGVKLGTPQTYGWHDLRAFLARDDVSGPLQAAFRGGIKTLQFTAEQTQSAYTSFHIPHDYLPGSDLFVHVHWVCDSATITSGSVTWGFEATYAKGHQQEAFSLPITVPVTQDASSIQYYHMVAETALSVAGGSGNQLDSNDIEVDGICAVRLYLDSNDIVDSVAQPAPFVFFVDLHYQSTQMPTINKSPDFYGV